MVKYAVLTCVYLIILIVHAQDDWLIYWVKPVGIVKDGHLIQDRHTKNINLIGLTWLYIWKFPRSRLIKYEKI